MPQEAYVWQRNWTQEVVSAVKRSQETLDGFTVLAGEIGWRDGKPVFKKINVDFEALKKCRRPVGLALRIGAFSGPFAADDSVAQKILDIVKSILSGAEASGVVVRELQIDFDCAESKLDGYRIWLNAIRAATRPVPVRITALPSWLKRVEFKALATEAGAYVLQVHSVESPQGSGIRLCQPERAREWVAAAGSLGIPFRVALPTYACLVAFDTQGQLLGVSSEGPLPAWPPDARVCDSRADAGEMAELVQQWTAERPRCMTGIIWYRLPVESDTLNWRWKTLTAVIQGRVPKSAMRVEVTGTTPTDLTLVNDGEADGRFPASVEVRWETGKLAAGDAVGGYAFERQAPDGVCFRASPELARERLSPGGRHVIGWLRLEPSGEIHARILEN
jgi:hypothetical protein